mmetsp:Transcript_41089/g.90179  ORF Transcript_41089/g.90179 Transcript_41089/m.90179 type:complete len:247 (-) Transcript_41089:2928-3668(-)
MSQIVDGAKVDDAQLVLVQGAQVGERPGGLLLQRDVVAGQHLDERRDKRDAQQLRLLGLKVTNADGEVDGGDERLPLERLVRRPQQRQCRVERAVVKHERHAALVVCEVDEEAAHLEAHVLLFVVAQPHDRRKGALPYHDVAVLVAHREVGKRAKRLDERALVFQLDNVCYEHLERADAAHVRLGRQVHRQVGDAEERLHPHLRRVRLHEAEHDVDDAGLQHHNRVARPRGQARERPRGLLLRLRV